VERTHAQDHQQAERVVWMNWLHFLRQAFTMPPHSVVLKVINRTQKNMNFLRQRQGDHMRPTYAPLHPFQGEFQRYLSPLPVAFLCRHAEMIGALTQHYLSHRFDLLGSGWLQVKHGVFCGGIEGYRYEAGPEIQVDRQGQWLEHRINRSNLAESRRIWRLIDPSYTPIDWHLDFKSGYRWSEDIWYIDIPHGHKPGVDIKVPWELARMQHLPLLAWAYALAKDGQEGFTSESVYFREFRNQILDFVATNPPRFGVNWRSPMDVGIRVANWLFTYDLFRAYGAEFEDNFKSVFIESIYQHGQHIVNNLEWNEKIRGNHYLSNIVSLLFVAAYLPHTPETDTWLAFAVQELISEVEYQFNVDGSNFEASSSYHRLSAEMIIYATAIILGLPEEKQAALREYDCRQLKINPKLKPAPIPSYSLPRSERLIPFPIWYIERLEKMAEFTMHTTKLNGHIPQIGDNDSGRFLKLQPVLQSRGNSSGLYENYLDHRHLVAAMNGLFDREDFTAFTGQGWFEGEIVRSLAGNTRLPSYFLETNKTKEDNEPKLYAFSEFGLYIYRTKNLYLAVRCGSIGQKGNGGHAHNDNLSFELNVEGRDFIVDGGTYLYTPLPKIRNEFRSTQAHNTLAVGGYEQNRWKSGLKGLFSMMDGAQGHVLGLSAKYLKAEHSGFGEKHYRQFTWQEPFLVIEDVFDAGFSGEINLNLSPDVEVSQRREIGPEEYYLKLLNEGIVVGIYLKGFNSVEDADGFYSLGYGIRVKNRRTRCRRSGRSSLIKINTSQENYQH
jgi:hypothetical protein